MEATLYDPALLTVHPAASEYIKAQGGAVYLYEFGGAAMCCGRVNFGPSVELGIPKNPTEYILHVSDGISIYAPKKLFTPYPLTIVARKFLGVTSLQVDGWKLV